MRWALVLGFLLAGCSGLDITGEQLVQMNEDSSLSQMSCFEYMGARAEKDATAISNLTKDQAFMYLLMKSNNEMVLALMGKTSNPCGDGVNVYDMMARVAESQNEVVTSVTGDVFSAVKIVGGILAIGSAIDNLQGDSIAVNGDSNSDIGNVDTTLQTQLGGSSTGDNNSSPQSVETAEETEFTEDDPTCSVASRAAGDC